MHELGTAQPQLVIRYCGLCLPYLDHETSPVGSYSTGQEVTDSKLSADEESGMNYYQAASVNYGNYGNTFPMS